MLDPTVRGVSYVDATEKFKLKFGIDPDFVVRAPGRVNLIGEHIDYNGFGVLPMAVDQSIYCAVKVNSNEGDDTLQLENVDQNKYKGFKTNLNSRNFLEEDKTSVEWYKYFLCGVRGCLETLDKLNIRYKCKGVMIMVGGDIPASSGLSSSSALVCAAFVSTLKCLTDCSDFESILDRTSIADCCAKCERYIGTEGGGMDQAICLLAQCGRANLIDFDPLRCQSVQLPLGAKFLISNCCVESNKAAARYFNERVLECKYAAKLLARKLNAEAKNLARLKENLNYSKEKMLEILDESLDKSPYSLKQLMEELGSNSAEMAAEFCTKLKMNEKELDGLQLKLYDRAKHVYEENERVAQFAKICSESEQSLDAISCLKTLGELMDESHASCRDLYECSCPELDQLQKTAKQLGAYGSRLTGAGWGGCIVSLIDSDKEKVFLENMRNSYYKQFDEKIFLANVFATKPAQGLTVQIL